MGSNEIRSPTMTSPLKNPEIDPKPAVPKKDEKPIMGLKTNKNFVVTNAVENILAGKIYCVILLK